MKRSNLLMLMVPVLIFMATMITLGEDARPGLINVQGRLVEPDGTLVHGPRDMAFCIYNDPTAGELLWGDTLSVLVWGGIYDIMVGPIPQVVFYDSVAWNPVVRKGGDRWLGTTVIGDTEMQPRERIATVPYAIHADMVDGRDASEFVSSVHPDSAVGLDEIGKADRCKDAIPMLTVINECDGGAVEGRCLGGTGVTGVGRIGVSGLALDVGGIGVYAQAVHPDSVAGRFDGTLTVNGDAQLGVSSDDYHYLRIPAAQAGGYFFGPKPLDGVDAMDIGYNYRIDAAGNELYDTGGPDRGTTRLRLGHGWLLFMAGSALCQPDTVMSIDPNGKVRIKGGVCGPRLDTDTLQVAGTGSSAWAWIGGSSPAAADSACPACTAVPGGNAEVTGTVGIGTAPPSNVRMHVSGTGSFRGNHIALFENTSSSGGDGIAISVNTDSPYSTNRFMSFLNGSGQSRGRIEGQNLSDLPNDPTYIAHLMQFAYDITEATITLAAEATGINICPTLIPFPLPPFVVPGPPAFCSVKWSSIAVATATLALAVGKEIWYQVERTSDSNLGVSYQSGSGDYAEWLRRMDAEEPMQPGDIVGIWGGKITKRTEGAQQILVVSTAPIIVGNMPPENEEHLYEKVAFKGQVPVRIIGPAQEGDYIIPSGFEDGTGIAVSPELMTEDEYAKVVGRVWNPSTNPNMKFVTAVVGLNANDMAAVVKKHEQERLEIEAELEALKMRTAAYDGFDRKVSQLEGMIERKMACQPAYDNNTGSELAQDRD